MARSMHSCTHVLATSFYLSWLGLGAAKQCMQRRSTPARPPLLPSYLAAALLCLDRAGPPVADTGCTGAPFLVDNKRKRLDRCCVRAWTLSQLLPRSKQSYTSACMHGHAQTHARARGEPLAHHTQHTVPVPHTDTHPPLLNLSLHKTLLLCFI